jgi:hypothetical protein
VDFIDTIYIIDPSTFKKRAADGMMDPAAATDKPRYIPASYTIERATFHAGRIAS